MGWIIDSVTDHTMDISKYKLSSGSNNFKFTKELGHLEKDFINIQNIDNNECLKWCLVRYVNPVYHHPARIRKVNKNYTRKLDFKNIKFTFKIWDTHKGLKTLHQH